MVADNITTATQLDGVNIFSADGIIVSNSNLVITNSILQNGGVYVDEVNSGSTLQLANCILANNSTTSSSIDADNGGINNITVTNCTFANNASGAISAADGTLTVNNTLLWNNGDSSITVTQSGTGSSNLIMNSCAIDSHVVDGTTVPAIATVGDVSTTLNAVTTHDVTTDPNPFVSNTYTLNPSVTTASDYIDAGDNSLLDTNSDGNPDIKTDITGVTARTLDGGSGSTIVDLGATEYNSSLIIEPPADGKVL
jgi:hypothetical protein